MQFLNRYTKTVQQPDGYGKTREATVMNWPKIAGHTTAAVVSLGVLLAFWPLRTVPTGHRGVITVGGAIKTIEAEACAEVCDEFETCDPKYIATSIRARIAARAEGGKP
jgi:hypothetical protein